MFARLFSAQKVQNIVAMCYHRYLKESKLAAGDRTFDFYDNCAALYGGLRVIRERYLAAQPTIFAQIEATHERVDLVDHALLTLAHTVSWFVT